MTRSYRVALASRSLLIAVAFGLVAVTPLPAAQVPVIPDDVKATIRALVDEGYVPGIVVRVASQICSGGGEVSNALIS